MPSPTRLQKHPVSPLMHTVPLLFKRPAESEDRSVCILCRNIYVIGTNVITLSNNAFFRNLFGFGHLFPAAETPVQILFSDDGSLGVTFLRNAMETSSWPTNAASQVKFQITLRDNCTQYKSSF